MSSSSMSRHPLRRTGLCAAALAGLLQVASDGRAAFDPDQYRPLTSDRRAHRIGDTITVIVLESTRASSRAATESSRDTDLGIEVRDNVSDHGVGARLRGDDSGLGGTSRSGDVRAQLAVRVIDVDAGLLHVEGEQVLVVNGESQSIKLAGIVRAEDVDTDNTVLSNRISDARIEFSGRGVVSDAQRQNVIYRVLRWLRIV